MGIIGCPSSVEIDMQCCRVESSKPSRRLLHQCCQNFMGQHETQLASDLTVSVGFVSGRREGGSHLRQKL
eukprot:4950036-Amphidinium_carterae.1